MNLWSERLFCVCGPTLRVLKYLIENAHSPRCGADIGKATGVRSGTLYQPKKHLYRLTGEAQFEARKAFKELRLGYKRGGPACDFGFVGRACHEIRRNHETRSRSLFSGAASLRVSMSPNARMSVIASRVSVADLGLSC